MLGAALTVSHNVPRNPGNSAFVSKLDPALKQLGSSMKQRSETRKGASRPIALSSKTELEQSREQGTRSGGVAEYRWRPVLRQELKGKEEEDNVPRPQQLHKDVFNSRLNR